MGETVFKGGQAMKLIEDRIKEMKQRVEACLFRDDPVDREHAPGNASHCGCELDLMKDVLELLGIVRGALDALWDVTPMRIWITSNEPDICDRVVDALVSTRPKNPKPRP